MRSLTTASGHYTVIWTTKTGGWPNYINTNIAGLYRLVFGISDVKVRRAADRCQSEVTLLLQQACRTL
jgi:hypothetical protein